MAMDQTGIMALPEADQAAAPTLSLEDSYDAAKSALKEASPEAASGMDAVMQEIMSDVQEMSDEELDSMIDVVQQMHDNPEQYPQLRAQLIADGQADEEDLPQEYDPEFLAVALSVMLEAKRSRTGPVEQGPQGFAKGGIAEAAQSLAKKGRYGDTMLAHITPREAKMLRKKGGSGTINPKTGLPEFFLKKLFKSIGRAVKKILNNPIGRIIGTIALTAVLGPVVGTTLAAPLASAGTTLLAGGNLKDAFKSAAFSYLSGPGSPLGEYVSAPLARMGLEGTALQAATSGLLGTGAALLTGQKLSDAIKTGLTSSALAVGTKMVSPQQQAPAPVEDMGTMARGPLATTAADVAAQPPAQLPTAPTAQAQAAPSGDRLGDFIANIEQQERLANTPAVSRQAVPAATAPTITAPTVAPPEAVQPPSTFDAAKDWISKNVMPSGIQEAGIPAAQEAGAKAMEALRARVPTATPAMLEAAYQTAYKAAMPGMLATYGPITAAGIGALGMAGGFKAKPLESSPEAKELRARLDQEKKMLAENPGMFTPKGFERFGAVYNDKGEIVEWKPWTPASAGAFDVYNQPRSIPMPNYGLASLMPSPVYRAEGGPVYMADGGYTQAQINSALAAELAARPGTSQEAMTNYAVANYGLTPAQVSAAYASLGGGGGGSPVSTGGGGYTQSQINAALASELGARPGTTYEQMLPFATSTYGITPAQLQAAYASLSPAGGGSPATTGTTVTGTAGTSSGAKTYTQDEVNRALQTELGARPGTSYDTLWQYVQRNFPGVTADQFNRASYWLSTQSKGGGTGPGGTTTITNPDITALMDRIAALQARIEAMSSTTQGPAVTGWNISPDFSNYAASTRGTPITPTPSVLGGQVLGLQDPFGAGKTSPLKYLVPQPYNTSSMYSNIMDPTAVLGMPKNPPAVMADGGIAALGAGGYPRRTGQISGPGTEKSDSIPAMLSDGEFVMTAKAVRGAGGGDRREGAKKMYALMHHLEKNAARS